MRTVKPENLIFSKYQNQKYFLNIVGIGLDYFEIYPTETTIKISDFFCQIGQGEKLQEYYFNELNVEFKNIGEFVDFLNKIELQTNNEVIWIDKLLIEFDSFSICMDDGITSFIFKSIDQMKSTFEEVSSRYFKIVDKSSIEHLLQTLLNSDNDKIFVTDYNYRIIAEYKNLDDMRIKTRYGR
jgi:hypothetical protein